MISSKKCFELLKNKQTHLNNIAFLNPVYQELYKNIATQIIYSEKYKSSITNFKIFIKKLYNLRGNKKLHFKQIDVIIIKNAVQDLQIIIKEILSKRKNINGLESFCWLVLNITALVQLKDIDEEYLTNQVTSPQFIEIINNIDFHFFAIMFHNMLSTYELISPTRRKGIFDKFVFNLISEKLNLSRKIADNSNWLIDEKAVKKIKEFPLPRGIKYPDVICKINNTLFIGAHKEQNTAGGGQDNQAEDASRIFKLNKKEYEDTIKKIFSIDDIIYVIIYDTYSSLRTGRHWNAIYDEVSKSTNKYIVNSVIFKDLLKSCLQN